MAANNYLERRKNLGAHLSPEGSAGRSVMLTCCASGRLPDYSASPELAPATPISGKEISALHRAYLALPCTNLAAS